MNLHTVQSVNNPEAWRSIVAGFIVLGISMAATIARSQQVTPFGDVPAMTDFSEDEIAARGQREFHPSLSYSTWNKLCFRAAQAEDTKMVCRTTIEGKSDLGQVALKVTLIERKDAPAVRLQIFAPVGLYLPPGIKLSVDHGATHHVPFTFCLTNGCVAAGVADPGFLRKLEAGRTLSLEAVNTDLVTVIASLPLDNFAQARRGAPAQILEQKLEGKWEQPADKGTSR